MIAMRFAPLFTAYSPSTLPCCASFAIVRKSDL